MGRGDKFVTPLPSFIEGRHYISSAFSQTLPPLPFPACIFQLLPLFHGDAPFVIQGGAPLHFFCLFLDFSSLASSSKYFSTIALFFSCLDQPYQGDAPTTILQRGATMFLLPFPGLYLSSLFQHVFQQYCPFSYSCLSLDLFSFKQPYYGDAPPIILWRGATTFLLPFPRLYLPCLFQQIFFTYCPFSFHVLTSHIRVTPLP